MRRLAILLLLLALPLALHATPAGAHAFGQNVPASPLRGGGNLFSVDLLLGDQVGNDSGVLGQARFHNGDKLDYGLQVGFSGTGSGAVLLGGDLRPHLTSASSDMPLEVSADLALGLVLGDNATVVEFVPTIEASHRFPLSGTSQALSPYGGVGINLHHVSVDNAGSDTRTDVVGRLGVEWEAAPKLGVIGEFGFGRDEDNFTLGVNIPF